MYNKESIIFDINMITKLICYTLFILLVIINNNTFIFLLIEILILIESRKEEYFFKFNIISVIILLISLSLPNLLFIPKIVILTSYTYLLTKVININQLRYLIEMSFYKHRNNKITKLFLETIYYFKYLKLYMKKYITLENEYAFQLSYRYKVHKANKLTRSKTRELIKINEIRFYNYYNKKTYLEKIEFESWDYMYLIIHIILLTISVIIRR